MKEKDIQRILFYSPVNLRYGGGFEEWLKKTASILCQDYIITIAYGDVGYPLRLSKQDILRNYKSVRRLREIEFLNFFNYFFLLKIKSFFDLLHEFKSSQYIYFNYAFFLQEVFIYLLKVTTNKKIIVGFHAPIFFNRTHDFLFKYFTVHILKKFSAFHVVNPTDLKILYHFGFKNVHFIPNYLLSKDIPNYRVKDFKDKNYIFVGRYEKQKGLDILLRAIAFFLQSETNKNVKFHFYGSGSLNHQVNYLAHKYPDNVFNHQFVKDHDIIYGNKYFMIAPSRQESFGLVMLEAMSYGVPVVATRTEGAQLLVEHGKNGYLMNRLSEKEIIEYIEYTRRMTTSELISMSRKGYNKAHREFTEDSFRRNFNKLIRLL